MDNQFNPLKLENQLCFPLYSASREVVKKYHSHLEKIGLTYTQYITMMVMWECEKISVKSLGEKLFLDSGTLTPVLKNLEAKGYVSRKRSEEDERSVIVALSEEGKKLREDALEIPKKIAGCVGLNGEEALQLYKLLYKILGK